MTSVYIHQPMHDTEEHHDLNLERAFELALSRLYQNGELVPCVSVDIRDENGIVFTATNPTLTF